MVWIKMNIGTILFWYILVSIPYSATSKAPAGFDHFKLKNADRTEAIFRSKSNCKQVAEWLEDSMNDYKYAKGTLTKCYPEYKK